MREILLLLCCLLGLANSALAQQGPYDVSSFIGLSTFARTLGKSTDGRILIAPNHHAAVFVTSRGLLTTNQTESSLWLVTLAELRHGLHLCFPEASSCLLQPRLLARLKAEPRRQANDSRLPIIHEIRWMPDSSGVIFLAEDGTGAQRLFEAHVTGPALERVSGMREDVKDFDTSGNTIVYSQAVYDKESEGQRSAPHDVSGMSLQDILLPGSAVACSTNLYKLRFHNVRSDYGTRQNVSLPIGSEPADHDPFSTVFVLSPNGRSLIRTKAATEIMKEWEQYDPPPGRDTWRIDPGDPRMVSVANRWRLRRYVLTDTATGQTKSLIDGPIGLSLDDGDSLGVVWSLDGSRILVGNVALPLYDGSGAESEANRRVCAVASVEFPSLDARCVVRSRDASSSAAFASHFERQRVVSMSFGSTKDEVNVRLNGRRRETVESYALEGGVWKMHRNADTPTTVTRAGEVVEVGDFLLQVHESLNEPEELWAWDRNKSSRLVWKLNRSFNAQGMPQAEQISWIDSSGYRWMGLLVKPRDYSMFQCYPLVIQTHGADPSRFLIDGKYPTAEAARALASNGFIVLQMPYRSDHINTMQEPADQIVGYKSAIAYLDNARLIDPHRVGIVAFSRTGFHVEHALIEAPHLFAAAVIADASDYSYMPYRLFGNGDTFVADDIQQAIGAKPYGVGLNAWIRYAADFQMDKVETPVLIQALGPDSVLLEWELFTSLRQAGKKAEMLYLPKGQHLLQSPRDVYASQQATVDWFRKWLSSR